MRRRRTSEEVEETEVGSEQGQKAEMGCGGGRESAKIEDGTLRNEEL
jgi:hypothetical protein